MVTEDYVPYEIAKLLKEKGFNWNTDKQFNLDKIVGDYNITDRSRYPERYLDAPTLQMAMRWLREVHNLHIVLLPFPDGTYEWEAYVISEGKCQCKRRIPAYYGYTYEQACIEGIHYCLENLI